MTNKQSLPKRAFRRPGIVHDAAVLGVGRVTLWRALATGEDPKRSPGLLNRYQMLVAERETQETRGVILPTGFSFQPMDSAEALRLAVAFPGSLTLHGSCLNVIRPLILSSPDLGPSPAACPSQITPRTERRK